MECWVWGPVTIAVDSYGPVTDNAQSIFELSLIESIPKIDAQIQTEYGFKPNFDKAKKYLEANDGAGNTFKATAKPVLIGTAVVGVSTMIFSLILVIKNVLGVQPEEILTLLNPYTILGFLAGGSVIYWFTGASIQAVTAGAHRAVEYIKTHIRLDENASQKAAKENSKEVVKDLHTVCSARDVQHIYSRIFLYISIFFPLSSCKRESISVAFRFLPDLHRCIRIVSRPYSWPTQAGAGIMPKK